MLQKTDLVTTRLMTPDDKNFIMATWLKGLRYGNDWFLAIDKDAYYKNYHKVIETIVGHPTTTVKVVCLKDDPEVILGYSAYSGARFHWLFVKKSWRGIGIGKSLVPLGIRSVTHLTKTGKMILEKYPDVVFDPFL